MQSTLCVIGLLGAFYFVLMFDTSVPTEAGGRVNNIGLIADRQNGLIFSLGLAIIGTLLVVGGNFRNVPVKARTKSSLRLARVVHLIREHSVN